MSNYYKTNALYDYLDSNPNSLLKFPKGDLWALIYADYNYDSKVLVLAVGTQNQEELSRSAIETKQLLEQLSEKSGVPLVTVVFRTDVNEITEVDFAEGDNPFVTISLVQLANELRKYDLPVNNTPTSKAINDASSSAYQNWQRANLGNRIVAVDIDLFKVSEEGEIKRFYELKRSFYTFDQWKPYQADFNNFKTMSNLANQSNIDFDIVYNRRTSQPWFDDISRVNVFNVNYDGNNLTISDGKVMTIDSFMKIS